MIRHIWKEIDFAMHIMLPFSLIIQENKPRKSYHSNCRLLEVGFIFKAFQN